METCQHALDQLIIHSQPTHAVAVFDDDARSSGWRHQRLPDYKAGRPPMPDDLHNEMPALRAAFEQRGVRCWASDGNEADDLAATLALKVTEAGHQQPLCQPIKAIASCSLRDCAFATTSRNAGWTRRLLKKSLAYFPGSCRITGVWQESAVRKSRRCRYRPQSATQLLIQFQNLEEFTPIWTRCRKSGAKA